MKLSKAELAAMTPTDFRYMVRRGEWTEGTGMACRGYVQANVAIVPKDYAYEFLLFCTRNPRPCPVIDVTEIGDPHPKLTPDADLRTDFDLLKKIAEVSGGIFYEKDQVGNFLNDLELVEKQEERTREIQLWNHPIFLILFIGCLSAEWAIRKRAQLL